MKNSELAYRIAKLKDHVEGKKKPYFYIVDHFGKTFRLNITTSDGTTFGIDVEREAHTLSWIIAYLLERYSFYLNSVIQDKKLQGGLYSIECMMYIFHRKEEYNNERLT